MPPATGAERLTVLSGPPAVLATPVIVTVRLFVFALTQIIASSGPFPALTEPQSPDWPPPLSAPPAMSGYSAPPDIAGRAVSRRSRIHLRALPAVAHNQPHFLPAPTGAATLDQPVLVRTRGTALRRQNRGTRTRLRRVKTRQVQVTRCVSGAPAAPGAGTSAQTRTGATPGERNAG